MSSSPAHSTAINQSTHLLPLRVSTNASSGPSNSVHPAIRSDLTQDWSRTTTIGALAGQRSLESRRTVLTPVRHGATRAHWCPDTSRLAQLGVHDVPSLCGTRRTWLSPSRAEATGSGAPPACTSAHWGSQAGILIRRLTSSLGGRDVFHVPPHRLRLGMVDSGRLADRRALGVWVEDQTYGRHRW